MCLLSSPACLISTYHWGLSTYFYVLLLSIQMRETSETRKFVWLLKKFLPRLTHWTNILSSSPYYETNSPMKEGRERREEEEMGLHNSSLDSEEATHWGWGRERRKWWWEASTCEKKGRREGKWWWREKRKVVGKEEFWFLLFILGKATDYFASAHTLPPISASILKENPEKWWIHENLS